MTTIEGNKLIAEFMGNDVMVTWKDANGKGWNSMVGIDKLDKYDEVFLDYHKSWDWLMPVVEKIKNCGYNDTGFDILKQLDHWIVMVDIKEVFNCAVQFIQWYNTQTKLPNQ